LKNGIITLLLIFFLQNTFGQTDDRKYLRHYQSNSTTYFYGVTEIIIHSDSTYTWKSYEVNSKNEWKKYKKNKPEISVGKITQNGKFITLTEYRNGNKTDFNWTVKITNKRLNFYYPNKNEKLRKSAKYKRIL
jgi:hypothetical protein